MMVSNDDATEIDVPHWFEIAAEIKQIYTPKSANVENGLGDSEDKKKYVVLLTSGNEDGGKRATLAFSAACTAISMDFDTVVFLMGEGSHWAYEGACNSVVQLGFPPLAELLDSFLSLGGRIYSCAACDEAANGLKRMHGERKRRHNIQTLGLAPVLTHLVDSTSVTF